MGRCNNRRTQQRAEAMRNTPARARFSSGPPNKKTGGRGGSGRGAGRGGRNSNRDGGGGGRGGGRNNNNNTTTTSRRNQAPATVVQKITQRVANTSSSSSTTTAGASSTTGIGGVGNRLRGVNVSKLDQLTLSEESITRIMQVLEQLNVVNTTTTTKTDLGMATLMEEQEKEDFAGEEQEEPPSFADRSRDQPTSSAAPSSGGYVEYEEDYGASGLLETTTGGDVSSSGNFYGIQDETEWEPTATSTTSTSDMDRDDSVFQYLNSRLSFPAATAARACHSIQDWAAGSTATTTTTTANTATTSSSTSKAASANDDASRRLTMAMDWLCLHLDEKELEQGFCPNPNFQRNNATSSNSTTLTSSSSSINVRAIPHPSISVAVKLTDDVQWQRMERIQKRVAAFHELGFHYADALHACTSTHNDDDDAAATDVTESNNDKNGSRSNNDDSSSLLPSAIQQDTETLRVLLTALECETLGKDNINNNVESPLISKEDLELAMDEQEQEKEALAAIYEGDLFEASTTSTPSSNGSSTEQYRVTITPEQVMLSDGDISSSNENGYLFVFLRPGYPTLRTPLFFFYHAHFPAPLLRSINAELVTQAAAAGVGDPLVFEMVSYLVTHLPSMYEAYQLTSQQEKEDQKQAHAEKKQQEARRLMDNVVEEQYANDGKLGRRQRARLKGAERAYDRDEKLQQANALRREQQAQRLEKIQAQQDVNSIRQTLADRAIEERERARHEDEIKKRSRAAMSAALNRDESVEDARLAAKQAEMEYRLEWGLVEEEPSPTGVEPNGTSNADASLPPTVATEPPVNDGRIGNAVQATPTTMAFMGRLGNASLPSTVAAEEAIVDTSTKSSPELPIDETEPPVNGGSHETVQATPTTMTFMHRLRSMYSQAAESKESYGLREPTDQTNGRGDDDCDDRSNGNDDSVAIPRPVAVPVGDLASVLHDVVKKQEEEPWLVSDEARTPVHSMSHDTEPPPQKISEREKQLSLKLMEEHNRNRSSKKFGKMLTQREILPAYIMRDEIVSTIANNQITVISGATGSGKTTQVPQFILDDMINNGVGAKANMLVTQPRRISAIGVAERVAQERCEKCGETVGYSIKLEKKCSTRTRLLLCTTGILLRRLQGDPDLASVSHVFVDETHERDLNTDFLLIILKDLLIRRKSLKLILMSATLKAEVFADYFGGCAVVSIPGRAHPVQEFRLEDILQLTDYEVMEGSDYAIKGDRNSIPGRLTKSALRKLYYPKYKSSVIQSLSIVDENVINYELLAKLLEYICLNKEEGAILVFLPGMQEITKAIDEMRRKELFQSSGVIIYPLHSALSTAEQTAVFDVPPPGVRKIVVSTNIAETSITIEDVVYVVDAGRHKENRQDLIKETPELVECWVSKASATQRRGRAGRVRPGVAWHMYSSHTHDNELQDYQLPEMIRVGVEELTLQILILDLGEPASFLAKALSPPSAHAMSNSLQLLEKLGAIECQWNGPAPRVQELDEGAAHGSCSEITATAELTALGFHLATLPVEPRVGKLIIYGSLFGCVDPALTIAASMSSRSPFMSSFESREAADEARQGFATEGSDHLTVLSAFTQWKEMRASKGERAVSTWMKQNYLGRMTLFQIDALRKQYAGLLVDIGFLPKGFRVDGEKSRGKNNRPSKSCGANANAGNSALLKAILCAGLYPNVIIAPRSLVDGTSKQTVGEFAFQSLKGDVHLHPSTVSFSSKQMNGRYCVFHNLIKTSKMYVRDCTTVSPFALLLFGGALHVHHQQGVISVDDWLMFRFSGRKPPSLIKYLRGLTESMLLRKIISPEDDVTESPEGKALIQSISALLQREEPIAPRNDGAEIVRPYLGPGEEDGNSRNRNGQGNGGRGRSRGGRGGRGRGSRRGSGRES